MKTNIFTISLSLILNTFLFSTDFTPYEIPSDTCNNNLAILKLIAKYLPENPIIIEAGTFDGSDSLLMATLWPKGTIYSFEPVPELYQNILNRIKDTSNIFLFEYALGDKNGIADFYISAQKFSPEKASASSSLLPPSEKMNSLFPELVFNKKIEVPVITLDTWSEQNNVDHIDMLWLDMQGYELNMLLASPQILQSVQAIFIEVEFIDIYEGQYLDKDIIKYLTNIGFTILAKDFKEKDKSRSYGNILFIKNNTLEALSKFQN